MQHIFIQSIKGFGKHGNARFSAAIAYYMIFCLVPILLIFSGILGFFFTNGGIEQALFRELGSVVGKDIANFLMAHVHFPHGDRQVLVSAIGILLTLWGTAGVFKELKIALDVIFEVPERKRRIVSVVAHNLSTFLMLFATGVFIMVSFLMTVLFEKISPYIAFALPGGFLVNEIAHFFLSFTLLTALFMFLYTFIPDTKISFRTTFIGSIITSFFFTIGKTFFAFYVGVVGLGSLYGAASALLLLLLWLFYSTQLFLFGAEVTTAIKKHLDN